MSKTTRSFRVDDDIWQLVEKAAKEQGKRTSDILNEAVVNFVGDLIRKDNKLSAQQLVSLLQQVKRIETEMSQIKKILGDEQ